jgi:sucrose-6-phosphate hydrolase SacC (GH32 family)
MTIPRSLTLMRTSAGLRLAQKSVEELGIVQEEPALVFSCGSFAVADLWLYQLSALDALLDVEVKFSEVFPNAPFVINIHTGTAEVTTIAIDPSGAQLAINRRIPASKNSIRRSRAPPDTRRLFELPMATSRFDSCSITSSLEVFAQDGETVLTDRIFPSAGKRSIGLSSSGWDALSMPEVERITIYKLRSAVIDE